MHDAHSIQQRFACLFPGLLGVEIGEATQERVTATMAVRADLCTTRATLHGGAIMAFADTLGAIGTILNLPAGKRTTTIDSSTKFIRGAVAGSTVSGVSVPLHRGRTTMVWQTTIHTEDGKLCAVVTQTQLVMDE